MDVIGVGGINFEDHIARFSSRGMTTWVKTASRIFLSVCNDYVNAVVLPVLTSIL